VEGDLFDIAADGEYVYFATGTTVERMAWGDPGAPEVLVDSGPVKGSTGKREIELSPEGVVLGGGPFGDAYVQLIPFDGGPVLDLEAGTAGTGSVLNVATSASRVFWITRTVDSPYEYSLFGSALDGEDLRTYLTGQSTSAAVDMRAGSAYLFFPDYEAETIRRRPVGAGSTTDVISELGTCGSLALGEERLFFRCFGDDGAVLWSSDLNGNDQVQLITEDSPHFRSGSSLEFSDGRLYWLDTEDGTQYIRTVDENGKGAETLYSTIVPLVNGRIAVSSNAVVFAEDVTIRALAR
jgi:hypothetical protein